MRVLILPAAGEGSRFRQAGYKNPKPFIDCGGVPMVHRAAAPFRPWVDRTLLILREEHRAAYNTAFPTDDSGFEAHFIRSYQEGAALSILSALGQVNDDDEIIIANSDQFFGENFPSWPSLRVDGLILTFKQESGAWSYVETLPGDPELVTRVAEKQQISNIATCGVYYFRSWRLLRTAICNMVAAGERYKGEFYLAPVYNHIIKAGGTVRHVDVGDLGFQSVGTPELLKVWEASNV